MCKCKVDLKRSLYSGIFNVNTLNKDASITHTLSYKVTHLPYSHLIHGWSLHPYLLTTFAKFGTNRAKTTIQ